MMMKLRKTSEAVAIELVSIHGLIIVIECDLQPYVNQPCSVPSVSSCCQDRRQVCITL